MFGGYAGVLDMGWVVATLTGHSYIDGARRQRATSGSVAKQGDHCDRSWCCGVGACLGCLIGADWGSNSCTLTLAKIYCSTALMLPFMVLQCSGARHRTALPSDVVLCCYMTAADIQAWHMQEMRPCASGMCSLGPSRRALSTILQWAA